MLKQWLVSCFLPTERNNWRAWILQTRFLGSLVIVILLGQLFFKFLPLVKPGVLGYSSTITPAKIIELTNWQRHQAGLPLLKENKLLDEAARRKAADMFAFNYWSHISPSGRSPWSFFREVGYHYTVAGENLAKDFNDAESVVQAWMASPSHRDNILDGRFRDIGVAVVRGELKGVQTTLIVQLFGAPVNAKPIAAQEKPIAPPPLATFSREKLESKAKPIAPMAVIRFLVIFVSGLIGGALVADSWFARHHHLYRLTGRNAAHTSLLLVILLLALLAQQGVIY